jgi:ribose-phosphate pyrophosphokinase
MISDNFAEILNLTKGFEPFGSSTIEDLSTPYPSKVERNVLLTKSLANHTTLLITYKLTPSDSDMMKLWLATDAARRIGLKKIGVFIPYLPYARQDRSMATGDAEALRVLANLLNAQNYTLVASYDVHSVAAGLLINNFVSIPNNLLVRKVLRLNPDIKCFLVAPDAGAAKKVDNLCKFFGSIEQIQALKVRVGRKVEVTVPMTYTPGASDSAIIVDDICDGGATFIALAKKLKDVGFNDIQLVVSHGLFTKGVDCLFDAGIKHIHTTDSVEGPRGMITEFKMKDLVNI